MAGNDYNVREQGPDTLIWSPDYLIYVMDDVHLSSHCYSLQYVIIPYIPLVHYYIQYAFIVGTIKRYLSFFSLSWSL